MVIIIDLGDLSFCHLFAIIFIIMSLKIPQFRIPVYFWNFYWNSVLFVVITFDNKNEKKFHDNRNDVFFFDHICCY